MKYLIVFALCFLATLKVSLQSHYGKKYISTKTDMILYNCLVFAVAVLPLSGKIIGASFQTWIYAGLFGLFSFLFQLTYTNALSLGNVSLSAMIVNLYIIMPICVSVLIYDERLTIFRIIGIVFTILSFVMGVQLKKGQKTNTKRWTVNILCALLANSALSVVQQIFGKSQYGSERDAFVSCAYMIAALASLITFLLMKKKTPLSKIPKGGMLGYIVAIGCLLTLFQTLNTYAISTVEGTFLFPVYAGGAIILSTLSGLIFFKDKLSIRQKLSIVIGIIAVIFTNLQIS